MADPEVGQCWIHNSSGMIMLLLRDVDNAPELQDTDYTHANFLTLILFNPNTQAVRQGAGRLDYCYVNPITYTRIA